MGRRQPVGARTRIGSQLDPLNPRGTFLLGVCLYQARRFSEAAATLRTGVELYPSFWPMRLYLGKTHLELGDFSAAVHELSGLRDYTAEPDATLGCAYARMGRTGDARKVLEDLKFRASQGYVSASQITRVHGALGEKDDAFAWLERGYLERDTWLTFLRADAINDSLRADGPIHKLDPAGRSPRLSVRRSVRRWALQLRPRRLDRSKARQAPDDCPEVFFGEVILDVLFEC